MIPSFVEDIKPVVMEKHEFEHTDLSNLIILAFSIFQDSNATKQISNL